MGKLEKNRGYLTKSVAINDVALIDKIVEEGAKEEVHNTVGELFIVVDKFLKLGVGDGVYFDWSKGLKIEVVAVIGDEVNNGHGEKRFEKIDGIFTFGSDGVSSGKTRFVEVDVFDFVTRFENYLSLGKFLDRVLGKKLFEFGVFCFGHKQLAIIYLINKL